MLKAFIERTSLKGDLSGSASLERVVKPLTCTEDEFEIDPSHQSAILSNSEMLEKITTLLFHLKDSQSMDVCALAHKYPEVFNNIPTQTTVLQHAYRVNPIKRKTMSDEVAYLLEHGFARPSCSPWSSPCILVPKTDGTSRFCTEKLMHLRCQTIALIISAQPLL